MSRSHPDITLSVDDLKRNNRGYWGEHPDFPVTQWRDEVTKNVTRLGYWEWVHYKIQSWMPLQPL